MAVSYTHLLVIDDKEEVLSYNKSALTLLDVTDIEEGPQHILSLNRSESLRETLDKVLAGEDVYKRQVFTLARSLIGLKFPPNKTLV